MLDFWVDKVREWRVCYCFRLVFIPIKYRREKIIWSCSKGPATTCSVQMKEYKGKCISLLWIHLKSNQTVINYIPCCLLQSSYIDGNSCIIKFYVVLTQLSNNTNTKCQNWFIHLFFLIYLIVLFFVVFYLGKCAVERQLFLCTVFNVENEESVGSKQD